MDTVSSNEESKNERDRLRAEIEGMIASSSLLPAGSSFSEAISEIISRVLVLLGVEIVLLWVKDAGGRLSLSAAEGISTSSAEQMLLSEPESVAAQVAETGNPLVISASRDIPEATRSQLDVKSAVFMPVTWKKQSLGVLACLNRDQGFGDADIKKLLFYVNQVALAINATRHTEEDRETYLGMVTTLAEAVDARDPYTFGHSKAVSDYCVVMGKKLGMAAEETDWLQMAGILHDVGKLTISDTIIRKETPLTAEEREIVKTHPLMSARILQPIKYFEPIIPMIRHHHERYDGSGYPSGLKGENIPYESRIMAVADSFDAMSSKRIYRDLMNTSEILSELKRGRGKQFDPDILDVFIKEFEIDRTAYRAGARRLGDMIHAGELNYYDLAIGDSTEEVERIVRLLAVIIESIMRTLKNYAGPLVGEKTERTLNLYAIENRLDFILTDGRLNTEVFIPINLVEIFKRFEAYLDYLEAVLHSTLSAPIGKLVLRDASSDWDDEARGLFERALTDTRFFEAA